MIKREELTNPNSCMSNAEDDEMTFVMLDRDRAAPDTIRDWCHRRVKMGMNKYSDPKITEAFACADEMDKLRTIRSNALMQKGRAK